MELVWNQNKLVFEEAALRFEEGSYTDVFAQKNNKSLRETVAHGRYRNLTNEVTAKYKAHLEQPIGEFLSDLKETGDPFYLEFLNAHGDSVYCKFGIADGRIASSKGLYAYQVRGKLVYISRCLDTYKQRINQGYGRISPKNCYRDGQSTNCHINSLIAQEKSDVRLFVHVIQDDDRIIQVEVDLIDSYQPDWNIQLKR